MRGKKNWFEKKIYIYIYLYVYNLKLVVEEVAKSLLPHYIKKKGEGIPIWKGTKEVKKCTTRRRQKTLGGQISTWLLMRWENYERIVERCWKAPWIHKEALKITKECKWDQMSQWRYFKKGLHVLLPRNKFFIQTKFWTMFFCKLW